MKMSIFRLENHVPDVLTHKSRDFQFLCRLFDFINNSTKVEIDSILDIINTEYARNNLLPLLATKIGFFDYQDLNDESLRTILSIFPYIIKNKGSYLSILYTLLMLMKLQHLDTKGIGISIINKQKETLNLPVYEITCYVPKTIKTIQPISKVMDYIVPTGYLLRYAYRETLPDNVTFIEVSSLVNVVESEHKKNYGLVKTNSSTGNNDSTMETPYYAVDTTAIISYDEVTGNE
jgi:hypothetical protein